MKDFRCGKCGKLLGKIEGKAIIKCPRCGEMCYCGTPNPIYGVGKIEIENN